ncbi:MAG TPA: transposase, partial [Thermoleophilaceae bacterium]|nr:transposase [Thermoleophilaceae bacterium]
LAWASRSRLVPFVKLARTIRRHRAGILAAIRLGLSNGRLEGLNSRIRHISHRSFGFHSATPHRPCLPLLRRASSFGQAVAEERLQGRGDRGHDATSRATSSRPAACANSKCDDTAFCVAPCRDHRNAGAQLHDPASVNVPSRVGVADRSSIGEDGPGVMRSPVPWLRELCPIRRVLQRIHLKAGVGFSCHACAR